MLEKIFVEINGRKQGMFLQGANAEKPVLLFLHGGPGSPEIVFTDKYPAGLDEIFTVCWWEQRGSGISYSKKIKPEEMTMEQMISDTIAVTKYLCQRFHKEKIYLMGHSWGTFLGIHTAKQCPDLYYAYIGIGQVAQQEKSERLAYTYMLEEFRKKGDQKMVKQLEKCPIDAGGEVNSKYLQVRSIGMNKLGIGVMRSMTSMFESVKLVFGCKYYTLLEKFKYPIGLSFSNKYLWDNVLHTNLFETITELKLPVYISQGEYDYQVSYVIAKEFASVLKAPLKGFYSFHNSAHSPCFEKPKKCVIFFGQMS